jgi:dihydroflavonol-4-reductase
MPKTALVTGSTGFIGSRLCADLLNAGFLVRAFHRHSSPLALIQDLEVEHALGDITQPETLTAAMKGVDVVFHTASKVDYWRGQGGMYPVTVGGTRNVLEAASAAGVQRVVHTSSAAALGHPEQVPTGAHPPLLMNENHVWNYPPEWWRYGHAKHLAEREIQTAVAQGLDCVIVNPTVVLGPGDINRISGEIVLQAAKGIIRFAIPGGTNFVHINDVARGHLLALEGGRTGERYILGGENQPYIDLLQTTARIVGVRPPQRTLPGWLLRSLAKPLDLLSRLVPIPTNGDILRNAGFYMYYDTSKAQQELGLTDPISLETALQETYDWYRDQRMV